MRFNKKSCKGRESKQTTIYKESKIKNTENFETDRVRTKQFQGRRLLVVEMSIFKTFF